MFREFFPYSGYKSILGYLIYITCHFIPLIFFKAKDFSFIKSSISFSFIGSAFNAISKNSLPCFSLKVI